MGQRIPEGAQQAAPAEGGEGGQDQFGELVNNVIGSLGVIVKAVESAGGDPTGIGQIAEAFQAEVTKFAEQLGGGGQAQAAPGQSRGIPAPSAAGTPLGPQG